LLAGESRYLFSSDPALFKDPIFRVLINLRLMAAKTARSSCA